MAKTATVDRPAPPVEMGRIEAEAVTQAIKDNFDSLGAMLIQARDRKAYKALGYRTFEGYCKTEFGKSSSNAYRLIEDAKVVAQLEAEISKRYEEPVSLNIPSACLRPLKELPDIGEKLKAIDYAKKLATAEGEKATKKHLEIAVFQINGHRSDDFKSAIESLGFTKGVQVEVTKNLKKDRGFVTKVDKKGKIYIQLYNDGVTSLPYDATDLRILNNTEKPTISASDNTTNKGDKVRIFAKGLEGKTGEIYTWKMGRHALVMVEGESAPVSLSYAELELIQDEDIEAITVETIENKPPQWEENLNWTSGENHYYYFARENKIYNTSWPNNITITPDTHSKNPVKFIEDWMQRFAGSVAKSLVSDTEILLENQRLREQLVEAESVIKVLATTARRMSDTAVSDTDFLVEDAASIASALASAGSTDFLVEDAASTASALESARSTDFLVEDVASTASALASAGSTNFLVEDAASTASVAESEQTAEFLVENTSTSLLEPQTWLEVLDSNSFTQGYIQLEQLNEESTEAYRGWNIYTYDSSVADISHPIKGIFSIDFSWAFEKEIINPLEWLKNIINQVEDFCPGQLSLELNTEVESFPQALLIAISNQEERLYEIIDKKEYEQQKGKLTKREADAISANRLQRLKDSLQELRDFQKLRIGQFVTKRFHPETKGRITGFELSVGGMPLIWVAWLQSEGGEQIAEHYPLKSIVVEI